MAVMDEKHGSRGEHIDNAMEKEVENHKMMLDDNPNLDYTGVAKKTDPEEIRLVRKLDYRIMVQSYCPWLIVMVLGTCANVIISRYSASCTSSTTLTETP